MLMGGMTETTDLGMVGGLLVVGAISLLVVLYVVLADRHMNRTSVRMVRGEE